MTSLRRNIIANYAGQGVVSVVSIAFLPQYVAYLGVEAYGLIGLLLAVQAVFLLLDVGVTPTLTRELARSKDKSEKHHALYDAFTTTQWLNFIAAAIGITAVWASSDWLAKSWVRPTLLTFEEVSRAVSLLGLVAGLRLIEGLYRGALIGLQRQIWLNAASSILAIVRWVGGLGVLALWAPTIVTFFVWQAVVSVGAVLVMATGAYRSLPKPYISGKLSVGFVSQTGRFSSGMMTNAILALLLTQSDKILLSRILSLEAFGFYTLAYSIASVIPQLTVPITQAFYPQLTTLATSTSSSALERPYRLCSQLAAVVIIPLGLVLSVYNHKLLLIWSGNPYFSSGITTILSLLVLGNMLHCMTHAPNILRLAFGISWWPVIMNTVAVACLLPALIWSAINFGAIGASSVWLILNIVYIIVFTRLVHRMTLPSIHSTWILSDFFIPLATASGILVLSVLLESIFEGTLPQLLFIACTYVVAVICCLLVCQQLRSLVFGAIIKFVIGLQPKRRK